MNEALRKLIKRHEGLSLIPYECPAGRTTIGWGWNYDANPLPEAIVGHLKQRGSITSEMAEELLDIAIERSTGECRKIYPKFKTFSEDRQNALIDMMFNMGLSTMSKFSKTIHLINIGHWEDAADNLMLSKWYKQTGRRGKAIVKMIREG